MVPHIYLCVNIYTKQQHVTQLNFAITDKPLHHIIQCLHIQYIAELQPFCCH